MSSCSSYEATLSEEDRIDRVDAYVKKRKELRIREQNEIEEKRKVLFQNYYDREKQLANSIFNQSGITFIRFNSKRIKFSFKPCEVADYVSSRVIFYVSLRYRNNHWIIFRDTIPSNYKTTIYANFSKGNSLRSDEDVMEGIVHIYILLVRWAKEYRDFQLERFKRYKSGDDDIFLDSDDQELFLSPEEISELHAKRDTILKRMIPPTLEKPRRRNARYFLR